MKLLLLTPEYTGSGGGIITLYRALMPALQRLGVHVDVIEGSGSHAVQVTSELDCDGVRVQTLETARLSEFHDRFCHLNAAPTLRNHLAAAWAMWDQANYGQDYDVVEACDFGFSFVPPAVQRSCPLVVQCHGSIGQLAIHDPQGGSETEGVLARLLERAVIQCVQSVQTPSRANASFWRHEAGRPVECCLPAIVPRFGHPTECVDRGLVVGRVQRWKGPVTLCDAVTMLGDRAPSVDWVGRDMPWSARETSSAAHLSALYPRIWGDLIRHLPPAPPKSIADWQAAALFNLVPSLWDVFNLTAAEAMVSGRPTIVSSGAGASDLVDHGRNGYVFEAGNPASLAGVIDDILGETRDRLREIGSAGRATVLRELDAERVALRRVMAFRAAIERFIEAPPAPPSDWIVDICSPSEKARSEDLSFLSNLPLRALLSHVAARVASRTLDEISRLAGRAGLFR